MRLAPLACPVQHAIVAVFIKELAKIVGIATDTDNGVVKVGWIAFVAHEIAEQSRRILKRFARARGVLQVVFPLFDKAILLANVTKLVVFRQSNVELNGLNVGIATQFLPGQGKSQNRTLNDFVMVVHLIF